MRVPEIQRYSILLESFINSMPWAVIRDSSNRVEYRYDILMTACIPCCFRSAKELISTFKLLRGWENFITAQHAHFGIHTVFGTYISLKISLSSIFFVRKEKNKFLPASYFQNQKLHSLTNNSFHHLIFSGDYFY